MGWSNNIPNPLTIGGGGLAGEILIFDAAGNLVGRIDEDGMQALGDDEASVAIRPKLFNSAYGQTSGIEIYPMNPTPFPLIQPALIVAGFDVPGHPVLSLNSPNYSLGSQTQESYIDLYGSWSASALAGAVTIVAAGAGGEVDVSPKLLVGGVTVGASSEGVSGFSSVASTTSGPFVAAPTPNSFSILKQHTSTQLKVTYTATVFCTAVADHVMFGVKVNGVNYDVCGLYFNAAATHMQVAGTVYVAAGLAGSTFYTLQSQWKRYQGGGTIHMDGNDFITFSAEEVD